MAERPANGTDAAICRLLAAGPVPTAELAARLAIPERTARHRLYRLRQAGAVVTDDDGWHRLADPLPGLAAPALVAGVPRGGHLAASLAADGVTAAGPLPSVAFEPATGAEPVAPADAPVLGLAGTVVVAVLVVVAAAGGIGVWALRRWAAPAPAAPPPFPKLGNPWGGGPWSW